MSAPAKVSVAPTAPSAGPAVDWAALTERVAQQIAQDAARHDEDESFVTDSYDLLKREGFFKALVPTELGGYGLSVTDMIAIIRRLAAACGSTGLAFSMHCHLVAVAAWRWRNEKAPTEGLLKRVAGENLVLVSSGGSDWLKSAGVATKADGGFRITAKKMFSSGCLAGDLLSTSAVYDDPEAGPTVLHFAVPLKAEGVKVNETWRVMGMRGTGSHDVEINDVFIADAGIAGRRKQGNWHPLFHTISMIAFSLIYAAYVGVAEGARNRALMLARKKPAEESLTFLVGEMENAFASAELALAEMARVAETGQPGPLTTSHAMTMRTLVGQAAIRTVERAMEVVGGPSFYRAAGLERAFRDVQGARYHPLQEKQQLRYTGRVALGLDIDG